VASEQGDVLAPPQLCNERLCDLALGPFGQVRYDSSISIGQLSRYFGGIVGGIRDKAKVPESIPDTLSGLLSGCGVMVASVRLGQVLVAATEGNLEPELARWGKHPHHVRK
jgi:hypothetical protein